MQVKLLTYFFTSLDQNLMPVCLLETAKRLWLYVDSSIWPNTWWTNPRLIVSD